jgi:hypothetical protein
MLLKMNIKPDEICAVIADDYFYPSGLNLELATRAILNDHFKRLAVASFLQINSKASNMLQLTDLLLGAVIYDLKLTEGAIKPYRNYKKQILDFLLAQFKISNSFFVDEKGNKRVSFLKDKFKISIFKGKQKEALSSEIPK